MSYITSRTYDPATQKAVPKDAVVLDLSEISEEFATTWEEVAWNLRHSNSETGICIADQIEAQTKPPRIPEPDLYKVVEAGPDHDRKKWVRGPMGWTMVDATGPYLNWNHWDNLVNPRVV